MIRAEVAIIGAGPAGTAAALHLGQLGVKDVVLVDRADFPRDKTCGSGVSPKGIEVLKALGVWTAIEPHAYPIRGLRLVTPGDRELYVSGGDSAAAVICLRRTLDHILLDRARTLGVRFVPDFAVTSLLHEGGRVVGFTDRAGREVRARVTVVANGSHSTFTDAPRPAARMQAIMGWWEKVPFRPAHVEMVFDRMVSPCYGWLFPESDGRVNIGICYEDPHGTHNARALFRRFLDKHYARRLAGAEPIGVWKGHPITYAFTVGRLAAPGRLVIGEAARMVHPATAEGIYQGMRSGMLAADALADIAAGRRDERHAFAAYERRCRHAFRRSFAAARVWRALIRTPVLDWLVAATERPVVKRSLALLMARM